MEPKLVSIEFIPDHPKLMRLPSVSRSLRHSILPKSCQQMYERPRIYISNTPVNLVDGMPNFTDRKPRQRSLKPFELEKPLNKRPATGSYLFRKQFLRLQKPSKYVAPVCVPRLLPGKPKKNVNYYCEVFPPNSKKYNAIAQKKNVNITLLGFSEEENHALKNGPAQIFVQEVDKKEATTGMLADLNADSEENLQNIPEEVPSQENSKKDLCL